MFDDLTDKTDNKKLLAFEKTIAEGASTFIAVGSALLQIRDGKLYHPQYNSFEEYCLEKWDMDHSHAYRLMNSAQVVENLKSSPIGELLPANEAQTRPLTLLPKEQQAEAWNKAVESAPKGKNPSAGRVKKIVDRILAKTNKKKREIKIGKGWTHEELKEDEELLGSFTAIAAVYGNEDAKAIRRGTIELERADVLYLAKLPKAQMLEIKELILANRWKPKEAVDFLRTEPIESDRIKDLIHHCLSAKGEYVCKLGYKKAFTITTVRNEQQDNE
jgi:hypothetical protein